MAEWGDLKKVDEVNRKVNESIQPQSVDPFTYVFGRKDFWLLPDELNDRGLLVDSEDVAVAKYLILQQFNIKTELAYAFHLGVPKVVVLYFDGDIEKVLDFYQNTLLDFPPDNFQIVFTFDEFGIYRDGQFTKHPRLSAMFYDVKKRLDEADERY